MGRRRGPARRPARAPVRRTARRTTRRQVHRTRRRRRRRRMVVAGGMVVLAGSMANRKFSQQDVERIEQQTGMPAEELTEEQLDQAVQQLGIQEQPMTDADTASVAEAGPFEESDYEDAPDYLDELERLADLRAQGIITDDEFEAKKKELLGL